MRNAPLTLACILTLLAAPALSYVKHVDAGPLVATQFGGLRGDEYVVHRDGDTFEYSEYVTIDFTHSVEIQSFRDHFTIEPAAPVGFYASEYGHRVQLNVRKVPGVTYHIAVSPGFMAHDGTVSTAAVSFRFKTPASPPIPAPLRTTPDDAYRYGTLGHPFRRSLGGKNADRIVDLLARAGVRFVRIDYCGDQILGGDRPNRQPNFKVQDRILEKLQARGITELPIIDQYCAPKYMADGKSYPAIYTKPDDFAQFAGLVAQHLAEKFPAVTRIELFNEPNLDGWWSYPGDDPDLSSATGSGTARYMRVAYAAIKAAAPNDKVVGPALADGGRGTDARLFLEEMYRSGCRRSVCWDVLSVHNYSWMNPNFPLAQTHADRFDVYKDLQQIADQHGDSGTHVMLTEWGYSHAEKVNGFDPRVQAEYIALGFNRMLRDPSVDGIVYVNIYNGGKAGGFWTETQVVSDDFTILPGYDVIARFAGP